MTELIVLVLLGETVGPQISIYASIRYEVGYFENGITDGEDHPVNQRTFDDCGNDYYQVFMEGCVYVEGNSSAHAKAPWALNTCIIY